MSRRVLVVFAHPDPKSFTSALRDVVVDSCRRRGAEVRIHDLYDEGFSAAMSANEWRLRDAEPTAKPHLSRHYADVTWCDTLVFVYPTWWSAQPAVMKAWVDRVLTNDVAWTLDATTGHALPNLKNVRRLIVVTTHGRSKLVNFWCGQVGRFTLVRAVRRLCSWRCRAAWIAMYSLDRSTRFERDRFTQRVERRLRRAV